MAWEGGAWSRRYDLGDRGRDWIKGFTAVIALDRLRRWLLEMPVRARVEEMGGEAPCQLPRFWDVDD